MATTAPIVSHGSPCRRLTTGGGVRRFLELLPLAIMKVQVLVRARALSFVAMRMMSGVGRGSGGRELGEASPRNRCGVYGPKSRASSL